jgi:protein gp37
MGANSKIEWCHHTFNPWWGCQRVSPGCEHCYAEAFAKRTGHGVWGPTADRRFFGDKHWAEPLKWNRDAEAAGEHRRVFCASMADVFEDRRDLDAQRARLWLLIAETPCLDWLLLTKRPQNVDHLLPEPRPRNIWLGVTAEDQQRADERIPYLLRATWAAVRFVSYEPAIEAVNFDTFKGIDWLIVGGESGPGARRFDPEWALRTIQQCERLGAAPFVKQLGSHMRLRDAKGGNWNEWPLDLRVREFPTP